jgi:hypothetical protein
MAMLAELQSDLQLARLEMMEIRTAKDHTERMSIRAEK